MEFELNDSQKLIQATARRIAVEHLQPKARERDRAGIFPLAEMQLLGDAGFLGINIPENLGGAEAGSLAYVAGLLEIARADASVGVTMSVTNMVAETIVKFGTQAQKKKYVPFITSGESICAAFGLTEPQSGSDAASLRTTARREGDQWVLNGDKVFISHGDVAKTLVCWARTNASEGHKGISAFIVEPSFPGFTVSKKEKKMGLRGSSTVGLHFENCQVPADNLLGEEGKGFRIAMSALDGGRIGISAQAIGIARGALDASVRYAKERKQFGKALGDFQAMQWMLADAATELDAAELLMYRAAALKDAGQPFSTQASMSKVFATEAANRVCLNAVQIHGGYGYIDEFPVERNLRDVRVTTLYEGTSEIQRLVIARAVLGL